MEDQRNMRKPFSQDEHEQSINDLVDKINGIRRKVGDLINKINTLESNDVVLQTKIDHMINLVHECIMQNGAPVSPRVKVDLKHNP